MTERGSVYLERIRIARSAVSHSPFYTPEQRDAVLYMLHLIEFDEAPCDSDSGAQRENSRSEVEAEGPQSGGEAASPKRSSHA